MGCIVHDFAILHKITVEGRDREGNMGTKSLISVNSNDEIVPIKTIIPPDDPYAAVHFSEDISDEITDRRTRDMLINSLTDAIWDRYFWKGNIEE